MSEHREPKGLDDRFADWVDGRLDERARRELDAELARDPDLRRQAEEYRATVQLVQRQLAKPQAGEDPPGDLVARVLERVQRERTPLFRLVPMVVSLAAAAALVLMVVFFNLPPDGTVPKEMAKAGDVEEEAGEEAVERLADRTLKPVDSLDEAKVKQEEARKKTAEGKDMARVNDRLQAESSPMTPAPSKAPAPAAPAERPGTEQELHMRHRDRSTQISELRRITTRVFPAPAREERDQDQDKFAREPKPDARSRRVAEEKNKAADTQDVVQVPLVVVQLAWTPVVGGKTEFKKGQQQQQEQQQAAQGFLGYLSQQPRHWVVGNQTLQQAQAEDLSGALSRPQTGAGAAGAPGRATAGIVVQPGDQFLRISGSSLEVERLLQQLKEFLGKATPQVEVQEVPEGQLPAGPSLHGARKYGERQRGQGEMRFYLVLRQAAAAPTTLPPRGGRR